MGRCLRFAPEPIPRTIEDYMERKPKVLIVAEATINPRKRDCKVQNIVYPVVVGSLEDTGMAEVDVLFWDQFYHNTGRYATDRITSIVHHNKPDLAVVSCSDEGMLDLPKILTNFQAKGIPVVYLWWDFAGDYNKNLSSRLYPHIDLNVIMDDTVSPPGKYICMWSSHDTRIFYDPGFDRNIDTAFMGTSVLHFKDRLDGFQLLRANGIQLVTGRGIFDQEIEREDIPLTFKEYAGILQRTKIGLSFTAVGGFYGGVRHQMKGRTFEVMRCGAMLLESANPHTAKRFVPGRDYVEFSNHQDLLQKVRYYLAHDEERKKIARNGHERVNEFYNNRIFWREIFNRTLKNYAPESPSSL